MRPFGTLFLFCLLFCWTAAQAQAQVERPLVPVPSDALELAPGGIQPIDTPEKRDAVAALLRRAQQQLGLHLHKEPFDLKVSFNATGPWLNQGAGQMEEIWLSPTQWRWTAHVGGYSQVRVGLGPELAYDEQPSDMMPVPLQMLRGAIFTPAQGAPARESLRMAASSWSGAPVACLLMTAAGNPVSRAPGRYWPEREYCINPESGLLQIASVAPGYYIAYNYANAIRFHDQVIPGSIAISENNRTVLEARIESITDADAVNSALFAPTPQMLARGPSPVSSGPERFSHFSATVMPEPNGLIQPTIVHALIDQAGNVREAEALQTTAVSAAALEYVKHSNFAKPAAAGTLPVQREAFINVQFEPVPAAPQLPPPPPGVRAPKPPPPPPAPRVNTLPAAPTGAAP